MNPPRSDCSRFESLLTAHLQGDLDEARSAWMSAHSCGCSPCQEVADKAADADGMLDGWIAPTPPRSLRARLLRQLLGELRPDQVHCVDLRADIDAWQAGDLSERRSLAYAAHTERCAPCAHQTEIATGVGRLLSAWTAPEPAAGLRERVFDACLRDGRTGQEAADRPSAVPLTRAGSSSSPGGRPRSRRWLRPSLAAAAALLILVSLGLLVDRGADWVPPRPGIGGPGPDTPVNDLLKLSRRDVQVEVVSYEQFPGGIGRFDARPSVADRRLRKSGNRFHRALRKVLAETSSAGLPAPVDLGEDGR